MKTLKMMAIAFALIATVSCKNEVKDAENVVVDTVEKVVEKTNDVVANTATSTFKIEGMTCAIGCAAKIEKSLSKMEGVQSAKVDFETKTATVSYDADKVTTELLAAKVASNGDQYKVDFAKSCKPGCTKPCCAKDGKKCDAKKCDVKCSADCKVENCPKCAAKKAACKAKCTAKKAACSSKKSCDAKKCDTKCSPDCKDAKCPKCAAKKAACKAKCAAKKATCKKGCTKPCCAKKAA